jgi:hypothetical protein
MRSRAHLLAALVTLVAASRAVPNVGIFAGAGHTVVLATSAEVQLVSEAVRIVVGTSRAEYRFLARDADRTYHIRYVADDADGGFQHLFLWEMDFAPGETRHLRVSYELNVSITGWPASAAAWQHFVARTPMPMEEWAAGESTWSAMLSLGWLVYVQYVTETGASWAGEIERATFSVDTSAIEGAMRTPQLRPEWMKINDARMLVWRGVSPAGWAPAQHPSLALPLTGAGPAGRIEGRSRHSRPAP